MDIQKHILKKIKYHHKKRMVKSAYEIHKNSIAENNSKVKRYFKRNNITLLNIEVDPSHIKYHRITIDVVIDDRFFRLYIDHKTSHFLSRNFKSKWIGDSHRFVSEELKTFIWTHSIKRYYKTFSESYIPFENLRQQMVGQNYDLYCIQRGWLSN